MRLINLLPQHKQRELRDKALLHNFIVVIGVTVFTFALVILAQVGAKVYLKSQIASVTDDIAWIKTQVDKKENAALKDKIKVVNDTIADYQQLAGSGIAWSRVLKAFVVLPPPGVQIQSFTVEPSKKMVTITGFSPTRELVIELYNRIQADGAHFTGVDYPLENVAKPVDINFHFSFYIQEDLLKQP